MFEEKSNFQDLCKIGENEIPAKEKGLENYNKMSEKRFVGEQGCQMVCFQTKNPNLGKFWRV
jgi:hypothetical protein